MIDKNSYTSANSIPYKVILELNSCIQNKKIVPIHVQISITNKCNMNCSFCSYSKRNKADELSLEHLKRITSMCKNLGTKVFTVTGGGCPLLHPDVNEFFDFCYKKGIRIGLVTNGLALDNLKSTKAITWCRISYGDDRSSETWIEFEKQVIGATNKYPNIDWAFSYVVTKSPNYENIRKIIELANKVNATHVRLVPDLYNISEIDIDLVKSNINILKIDDKLVIYQQRNKYTKGDKECRISLLKPMIGSDGYVYPCCGISYSILSDQRDFTKCMKMGHYTNLPNIINNQRFFDGSICEVCFYQEYNDLLRNISKGIKHKEWV